MRNHHIFRELFGADMIQNVHPDRWQSSDPKACSARSAKIAFFIRIFGALNQIMRLQATFSFFF